MSADSSPVPAEAGKALAAEMIATIHAEVAARVAVMSGWTAEQITGEGARCGDILASGGEEILFPPSPAKRRKKKPDLSEPTAATMTEEQADAGMYCRDFTLEELWDAMMSAFALGALVPGGVDWMGLHYCTAPHKECPAGNVPTGLREESGSAA